MPNQPKPPAPGTRGHYISGIPDEVWEAAMLKVRADRSSVSAVVIAALRKYVDEESE